MGDLGKLIFAKGFKKVAQSPINRPIWSHYIGNTIFYLHSYRCVKYTTTSWGLFHKTSSFVIYGYSVEFIPILHSKFGRNYKSVIYRSTKLYWIGRPLLVNKIKLVCKRSTSRSVWLDAEIKSCPNFSITWPKSSYSFLHSKVPFFKLAQKLRNIWAIFVT